MNPRGSSEALPVGGGVDAPVTKAKIRGSALSCFRIVDWLSHASLCQVLIFLSLWKLSFYELLDAFGTWLC